MPYTCGKVVKVKLVRRWCTRSVDGGDRNGDHGAWWRCRRRRPAPVERGVTPTSVAGGRAWWRATRRVKAPTSGRRPASSARTGRVASAGARSRTPARARSPTPTAAARLADEAFAVVPAVGIAQEATTFSTERLPFVGVAGVPRVVRQPVGLRHHRRVALDAVEDREPRVGCAAPRAARRLEGEEGRGRHRHRPAECDPSGGDHSPHSARWASRSWLR